MKTISHSILCLVFCIFLSFTSHAQSTPAHWQRALQTARHDTERLRLYTDLANYYLELNLDSAFYYLKVAEKISLHYPQHEHTLYFLNIYGNYCNKMQDYQKTEQYYKQVLILAQSLQHKKYIKYAQYNLIRLDSDRGLYAASTRKTMAFLKTLSHSPYDSVLNNLAYELLANNFSQLDNKKQALKYLRKTLNYCKTLEDTLYYYRRYSFINEDDLSVYDKGLELARQLKNGSVESELLLGKADYYLRHGAYSNAIIYTNSSIAIDKLAGNTLNLMVNYHNLGEAYNGLGQYKKALTYFNQSLSYFKAIEDHALVIESLENSSESYKGLGNYKQAYEAYRQAMKLKEEIAGIEKQKIVAQLDAQYELNEKQAQIAAKELENKLQQEKLKTEKKQKYVFIGLIILLVGLFGWAAFNYFKKNKLSLALVAERNTVQAQAQTLAQLNNVKDKLFTMIGHDLRSPIAALKDSLTLWKTTENQTHQTGIGRHFNKVYTDLENVQLILNNLLNWASLQIKSLHSNPQTISLKYLIESIVRQLESSAYAKKIRIIRQLDDVSAKADENQWMVVLRNVLSNAIKFTPEGGFIKVSLKVEQRQAVVKIEDTGIGMTEEQLNEAFQYPTPRKGTQGEKGTGLGLSLCQELVVANGGILNISSEPEKGTIVKIEIPLQEEIAVGSIRSQY